MTDSSLLDESTDDHGNTAAAEIVRQHFSNGLNEICNEHFLSRRYKEFERRDDPIYATLMAGMDDEELAKTFVSYWTIGQTLSVKR